MKLFWKIFLSFWVSLILFVGVTLWLTSLYLEQTRGIGDQDRPRTHLRDYTQEARMVAHAEGRRGLEQWLRGLDRIEVIPMYLVDGDGRDLLQRPVPQTLLDLRARHTHRPPHFGRGMRLRGNSIPLGGELLDLIPDYQGVTLYRMLARPRVIAIPLIIAALVSALVCWLLTRYLTRPLTLLSAATRQFAGGNLEVRVAPTLGARRDEAADLAIEFDSMATRIQHLLDTHMQLVADISHELRSPLARLQVAIGLARQKGESADNPELDRIETEADRLNQLIGQVITVSRLESGTRPLHRQPLRLNELMEQIVAQARYEAKQQKCCIHLAGDKEVNIVGDASLLASALENVVRNAVRYTPADGCIEIRIGTSDNTVRIDVSDQGPGVPEQSLDRLFEPFFRVDPARDRHSGGFGLGLAIAARAITTHQGSIRAKNNSDTGLTISITLPLGVTESDPTDSKESVI